MAKQELSALAAPSRASGASRRWMCGTTRRSLLGPAFIAFEGQEGEMRFIALTAWLDVRYDARNGGPVAEFFWEGDDEGDQRSGRGWVALGTAGRLVGHVYIHGGDDSGLVCEPCGSSTAHTVVTYISYRPPAACGL